MTYARVRDDLAERGERIYDHKTGRCYGSEVIGRALIHSSDDYRGTVSVVTEEGAFFILESIDLDYDTGETMSAPLTGPQIRATTATMLLAADIAGRTVALIERRTLPTAVLDSVLDLLVAVGNLRDIADAVLMADRNDG
jgi:hypothetical protein